MYAKTRKKLWSAKFWHVKIYTYTVIQQQDEMLFSIAMFVLLSLCIYSRKVITVYTLFLFIIFLYCFILIYSSLLCTFVTWDSSYFNFVFFTAKYKKVPYFHELLEKQHLRTEDVSLMFAAKHVVTDYIF